MVRTWPTAWPTLTVMVPFELGAFELCALEPCAPASCAFAPFAFAPCTLAGEEKISLLPEPEGQPLTVLFS